jgi:hypothetical protein
MNKTIQTKLVFSILFLLVSCVLPAQTPEGGTMLNATTGSTYVKISSIQESGEGAATVIIEHKTTYEKQISHKLLIGN